MKEKFLNFSLINTKQCNLNCSYCYEKGQFSNHEYTKDQIDQIIDFLKAHVQAGNQITLTLIGGEPTLAKNNKYLFKKIYENFNLKDIKEIRIITNGYSYILLESSFPENFLKKFKEKLQIQISYDGKLITDIDRIKIVNDKIYKISDKILETFEKCIENNFNVTFKSTLDFKHFELVPEVLKEFRELNLKYREYFKRKNILLGYFVTEVKESFENYNKEEIKEKIDKTFPLILKEEKINLETLGKPLSAWFEKMDYKRYTKEKSFCQAGIKLFSIDTDLNLDFCHHVPYLKSKEGVRFGSILDPNLNQKMKNSILNFKKMRNEIPELCKNCEAIYCIHCPIENYRISSDVKSLYKPFLNENLCFYFKYISKYLHYFNKKFLRKD